MLRAYSVFFALTFFMLVGLPAMARDQVRAVGSSTVYPFVTVAAEEFGRNTTFRTPIVEATGTGGGIKLFCGGIGEQYADIVNASRAIETSELAMCAENGIQDVLEFKIGYDGIVLANALDSPEFSLTKMQIFLALAKEIPSGGKLVTNTYRKWSEIDPTLPDVEIEVIGPPPTSGTRDSFVHLVLEKACKNLPEFVAAYPDEKMRQKQCHMVREDGPFITAGENDNLIIQKLTHNSAALGIFGFGFLDQNASLVKAAKINGVVPDYDTIASYEYTVARPLYIYVKAEHGAVVPSLKPFVTEILSNASVGEDGYLTMKGLIPLPEEQQNQYRSKAASEL